MGKKRVIYNGVKMSAEWPAKIDAAQTLTHYTIVGQKLSRIRFGDDDTRWGKKPCLDCGVLKGQFHVPHCEYEKCPACGAIRAGGCYCDTEELRELDEEAIAPPKRSPITRWLVVVLGCVLIVLLLLVLWTIIVVLGK
jgi:hypothetical protein